MNNEIQQIIEQLEHFDGFPEAALRAAREHREHIIPALIETIERATERVEKGEDVPDWGHFFALFLLAEFRAHEALPAILRAVSLPGEGPFVLFRDVITESLPAALAGIAGRDNSEAIRTLLYDKQVNEYVRFAAANALASMAYANLQERDQVIAWLRQALRAAIDQADETQCNAAIVALLELRPDEVYDEIRDAYATELVDTGYYGDLAYITKRIKRGQKSRRFEEHPPLIDDCIEELRQWAAFDEENPFEGTDFDEEPVNVSSVDAPARKSDPYPHTSQLQLQTVRHDKPRVGRNDPCPCGSGKKFKKCCGAT